MRFAPSGSKIGLALETFGIKFQNGVYVYAATRESDVGKKRAENQAVVHQFHLNEQMTKKRCLTEMEVETEVAAALALSIPVLIRCNRKKRSEEEQRDGNWWSNGYENWDEGAFKKRVRVSRDTFEFLLGEIRDDISKTSTPMKPYPTLPATQLAICLYREICLVSPS